MWRRKLLNRVRERWPAVLVPALVVLLDVLLTIGGQPPEYWRDRSRVDEMSPIFRPFLTAGPKALLVANAVWVVLIAAAVLGLPRFLGLCASNAFTLGHAAAAAGWLVFGYHWGYGTLFCLNPVVAVALTWANWRVLCRQRGSPSPISCSPSPAA